MVQLIILPTAGTALSDEIDAQFDACYSATAWDLVMQLHLASAAPPGTADVSQNTSTLAEYLGHSNQTSSWLNNKLMPRSPTPPPIHKEKEIKEVGTKGDGTKEVGATGGGGTTDMVVVTTGETAQGEETTSNEEDADEKAAAPSDTHEKHVSFDVGTHPTSTSNGTYSVECRGNATPTSLRCRPRSPRSPRCPSVRGFAAPRCPSSSPTATRRTAPAVAPSFLARCSPSPSTGSLSGARTKACALLLIHSAKAVAQACVEPLRRALAAQIVKAVVAHVFIALL